MNTGSDPHHRKPASALARTVPITAAILLLAGPVLAQDSLLSPAGPVAEAQRSDLIRVTLITMIAVVPVLVGVPVILWRYHRVRGNGCYRPGKLYRPDWEFSGPLEAAMWGVPFAIIAVLGWSLWQTTIRLDPYAPLGPDPLEVQAIGLDWKWLFLYPEQGIATLDALVLPAGRPVRVALTTDTVMQSFRVPALAGQIYAMPGMRTELNLMADAPGRWRGDNIQYSGRGFAGQTFSVVALDPAGWRDWAGTPAQTPLDPATYARLGRAGSPAQARALLGLGARDAPRLRLVTPDLFDRVIARYRAGLPVPPRDQPGAPAYAGDG
ncbi:cytochrome ubiquinol oxidase subunit II [Paracoccus sp. (in: a-proteobacteria)]|uniref:cytochrome ubiquinol oxidase subunit II n=1 Tax=Paracoccus sp. TaxID=267 RepID=UPI00405A1FA4